MNFKPLLKQCIAEVLVEPTEEGKYSSLAMAGLLGMAAMKAAPHTLQHHDDDKRPSIHMADPTKELPSEKDMDAMDLAAKYSANREKVAKGLEPLMKMTKFIKECIAEVIVEPTLRKKKVYGNPQRLQAAHLIKECVLEVLRENLSEAFDPTSQGPNVPQENPYPAMNAKMRTLEEEKPAEDAWARYERGYSAGQAHKRSGMKPKEKLDNVASIGYHDAIKGKAKASPDVVRKTVKEADPHGRYAQQAGATPFKSPGDTSIVEYDDQQATITKVKKEVFAALATNGFRNLGEEPRDYMEYYLNGFVTVSIYISYDNNAAHIERYYDSEMVDNIPGHHIDARVAIPAKYDPALVQKLIRLCVGLKQRAQGDESIFGGIDDIEEGQRTQSTNVEWTCPHCGQPTDIPIEIESPSDYIACADCEHCGKEIQDPKLDQRVYAAVIDYYSGKADYLKDTSMQEVKKKVEESLDPNSIGQSIFGHGYDLVNTDTRPDGTVYHAFQLYSDPVGKYNKFLVNKEGIWYWSDMKNPEKLRKLYGINPPPPKKPAAPKVPKPPKPRYKFNIDQAYKDLATKSSGNAVLDQWIKNSDLNAREAASVCLMNRGYKLSDVAKLLKVSPYRLEAIWKVAWSMIDRFGTDPIK